MNIVINVLPNPYLPDWLCPPNYLVQIDGHVPTWDYDVFTKKQLNLISK